jgi:GntR family transcriptional regulator
MLDLASPIPLYHQISQEIHRRIADGDYQAGGALPTEEELSTEFSVSRSTVRQALAELVDRRLIKRRRGAGTFVETAAVGSFGQRFRGSLLDLMLETRRAGVAVVEVDHQAEIPERIARALSLATGAGTVVRRTRTMDGEAFSYTVNFLPPDIGALLSAAELETEGLMWLLKSKGVNLAGARQSIRAQPADTEVSKRLSVQLGAAVLFVERLVVSGDGRPVELVQSWYRGDRYEYTVTLDLDVDSDQVLHAQFA